MKGNIVPYLTEVIRKVDEICVFERMTAYNLDLMAIFHREWDFLLLYPQKSCNPIIAIFTNSPTMYTSIVGYWFLFCFSMFSSLLYTFVLWNWGVNIGNHCIIHSHLFCGSICLSKGLYQYISIIFVIVAAGSSSKFTAKELKLKFLKFLSQLLSLPSFPIQLDSFPSI